MDSSFKIPKFLLKHYKKIYEDFFNETLDEDALVLPYDPYDIYNISPNNLMVCYG